MNIIVFIRLVPDLVEELTINDDGTDLDREWLRLIINEFDDHAMEQAILLKEQVGGKVTIVATDVDGADEVLFASAARGSDRLMKLTGDFESGINNHAFARAFKSMVEELQPDLILTGVQAHDDIDGSMGPLLAGYTGLPYIGYVSGVVPGNGEVVVRKEYPGGLIAEMAASLPAVLGIQSAEQPPRYVAISKVRQVMKTAVIDERETFDFDLDGGPTISRLFQPETEQKATMIEGDEEEVAAQLVTMFQEQGLL